MSEDPGDEPGGHRGGVPAGRILGIPIYFQPSWFVAAALLTFFLAPVVDQRVPGLSPAARYAVAALAVLLLFGSVLLHELAHSLVARGLGLPVRRIVLQLIGGVSEIPEPATAGRDYLVAVAGPLTSMLLSGTAYALVPLTDDGTVARVIIYEMAWVNGFVAAFNLLPGLPLDGGRVLRAVIWHLRRDKVAATRSAAHVGRAVAVLAFVGPVAWAAAAGTGLSTGSVLYSAVIAAFLWTAASQTLLAARYQAVVPHLSARTLARRALPVLADVPVSEAVRRAHETGSRALVVVDSAGRPEAIVDEAAVGSVPEHRRPWVSVGGLSRRVEDGTTLPVGLAGQRLVDVLSERPAASYLVVDADGALYGVLVQADVAAELSRRGR